jgi:integrase
MPYCCPVQDQPRPGFRSRWLQYRTTRTRLIKNPEVTKLFEYLDRADAPGLEHPVYTLAICLQFAFAARMSEIIALKWEWIEFDERRVVWPDSKTGDISKPLSDEAYDLL